MGTANRAARNDPEAKKRFLHVLNLTVKTVCPWAQWIVTGAATPSDTLAAVTVPDALPLPRSHPDRLYLRSIIRFTYADREKPPGGRKVSTLYYSHTIAEDETGDHEWFAWHWHPPDWPYPHLHIQGTELSSLHIPTGRVFLEQIIEFLVRDLGVTAADGWEQVLMENLRRVSKYATWGRLD